MNEKLSNRKQVNMRPDSFFTLWFDEDARDNEPKATREIVKGWKLEFTLEILRKKGKIDKVEIR